MRKARSPDENWRNPLFALRRLARLTTIEPARFAPALAADQAALLGARIAPGQRAALCAGGRKLPARAVFLASPTPRSGTNYVEALIAAHPGVAISPCGVREAPFLPEADRMLQFERGFARRHRDNAERIAPYEFLAHAATGFLARAAAEAPAAEAIVLKDPHARRLELLPAIMPEALVVLVLRDGWRTVDSMARTWPPRFPGRTFEDMCLEWALATEAALDFAARAPAEILTLRYEDAVARPAEAAQAVWRRLGLGAARDCEARLAMVPVMGSSTHSRGAEGVDWRPRAPSADFDPAGRPVSWTRAQERAFARRAARVQARLDREHPVGAAPGGPARAPGRPALGKVG
ncbi:sulfotransferase family protein [Oceanicella actignis]|uniref:sulfotransferase family protein n=1 Tax=Oceanicella actignis TaxID=1189325 RepID=UPI0011E7CC23|nr:sulfotransferase [Oceanicella actignis]TYO84812.1 sulfotransferase family protein [Oceanicella actignis]